MTTEDTDTNDDSSAEVGPTLAEWVRSNWLPSMRSQLKASTYDSYRRNCELHLLPYLGDRPLEALAPIAITSRYGQLLEAGRRNGDRAGLSPKTVRYLHTILHKALADAVDAGLLTTNPASKAKPPRPDRTGTHELRFWTAAQLRQFLATVEDHPLGLAFHLAAMTGMRRGEVLGLRWVDVDLEASWLAVRHTVISIAYEVRSSTPKTHRSRVIDLDPGTVERLRLHSDASEVSEATALVFCRPDGLPHHPDLFSQTFERLVERSGLPRIRLHDLRHTHATLALKAGVPAKVVSERLGHTSTAFTLQQYAHVIPGMQAEAARQIAALVYEHPG